MVFFGSYKLPILNFSFLFGIIGSLKLIYGGIAQLVRVYGSHP
ncbi:hypothetical protein CLOSBL3_40020 [Clostridiaceae bacterium BL-3]|nr:hypothetical protein CLOSBL3_40020 [Clostridiaceae bacterium BL-3]